MDLGHRAPPVRVERRFTDAERGSARNGRRVWHAARGAVNAAPAAPIFALARPQQPLPFAIAPRHPEKVIGALYDRATGPQPAWRTEMKKALVLALFAGIVSIGMAPSDADAKRIGAGGSAGMQRSVPARPAPDALPAKPATERGSPGHGRRRTGCRSRAEALVDGPDRRPRRRSRHRGADEPPRPRRRVRQHPDDGAARRGRDRRDPLPAAPLRPEPGGQPRAARPAVRRCRRRRHAAGHRRQRLGRTGHRGDDGGSCRRSRREPGHRPSAGRFRRGRLRTHREDDLHPHASGQRHRRPERPARLHDAGDVRVAEASTCRIVPAPARRPTSSASMPRFSTSRPKARRKWSACASTA